MTVLVATRLKVRQPRFLPQFLAGSLAVSWQARKSEGYLGGKLRMEPNNVFWTLTAWESGGAVAAFRGSGTHQAIAPRLARWANEGVIGVWASDAVTLPDWAEVAYQTATRPRFTELDHPTTAHGSVSVIAPQRGLDLPVPAKRTQR